MTQPEIRFKMPNWYYDKKALRKTPSFLDGISNSKEMRYRREGVRLIVKVGSKLGLKYETTASGTVYFHRFYMFHSFKQFPRFITSCCCLLLAGKVEETPKKCKQIIATAQEFLTDRQFQQFGDDPREEVMTLERILLKTIKFDLQVQHPYQFILKYAKGIIGDREKIGKMVQMAWTFINDSFQTTLCLQWEPEIIAIAAIYLASKLGQFEISDWQGRTPNQRRWWEAFASEVSNDLLEDICHQILDLYQTTNPEQPQDSPAEEEVSPGTPKRHRPASPPPPQPKIKQERKEDSHSIAQDNKKLLAPPMPVMAMNSVAPPLPKEPPQFFAPPPTEPPPIPPHQGYQSMPPLPPMAPQPNAIPTQPGLAAGQYSHPPPPLLPGMNAQGPPVHARSVGSSSSVPASYPPHGYYMPVPPPQDYNATSHQFYQNNTGAHHMGSSPHQVRQMPQAAGGPLRDHYRTPSQTHHPYMRGQNYILPQQRR